jgi:hypothetical protein
MLTRRSFLELVALGLMAAPRTLVAGASQSDSTESVARKGWNLVAAADAEALLGALEPEEVQRLGRLFRTMAQACARDEQVAKILDLFGVASVRLLQRLDPRQLCLAVLREFYKANPELQENSRDVEFTTLGHVAEGPTLFHVLYRLEPQRSGLLTSLWPNVVSLERLPTGWGMLLSTRIKGLECLSAKQFLEPGLLENLQVEVTDVIGHVSVDKYAFVVIRSRTTTQLLHFTKVGVVPIHVESHEYSLLRNGDRQGLLGCFNHRDGTPADGK